ncbi:MAG: cell division protein FtsA [Taibaiella sp.]|nr:cell division protein FtsA [Taibaiella sp.]
MSKKQQPVIVGLDIGTTKVVAIAGRKNEFGKVEVLGFGRADSNGVSHGVVMNIEQCIRSIEQAIENCIASNPDLDIREVYVGIAGQHIKSLQTRGDRVRVNIEDEISKDDIDLLIRDQNKTYIPAGDQIIDVIPQDFTVDSTPYVTNPIGMSGVKIGANFHLITGDRHAIRNIKRCVDKSHLITRDLVLQPLASAAAVMNDEDLEAGVAVVDIGGGTTDMAIFYDGILRHTAVIPYAGVNITNDIRNGLGVLRAQAEQMKVQFGSSLAAEANAREYITIPGLRGLAPKEISVRALSDIIQARIEEILDYVVFHLKQVNLDTRLHGGIILTGGGARLKHIVQLTQFKTGLNVRIGMPSEHLAGGHAEVLRNPMYATCIGLILRGYHDYENGKMQFTGDGNLYMPVGERGLHEAEPEEAPAVAEAPAAPVQAIALQPEVPAAEPDEERKKSVQKRNEKVKTMLSMFKGKFMEIFGEDNTNID